MTRFIVLGGALCTEPVGTITARSWLDAWAMASAMYGWGSVNVLWAEEVGTLCRWRAALKDRQADREEAETMRTVRKG